MHVALASFGLVAIVQAQERLPVERITVPGSQVTFEMVSLPGGALSTDAGKVRIKPFSIGAREVTWREFLRYWDSRQDLRVDGITRPSFGIFSFLQHIEPETTEGVYPVHSARWHSAMGYCAWLTKKTGDFYRLPTEHEWEYACRADGSELPLRDAAWGKVADGKLHEVGKKRPNAWGLYDVLGNVMEYCLEPLEENRYEPVLRGGAYDSPDAELTPSKKFTVTPSWYESDPCRPRSIWWFTNAHTTGLRVVRIPDTSVKDLEAYKANLVITVAKSEAVRSRPAAGFPLVRITGEVRNAGDRTLDELELTVYYLTSGGRPQHQDCTFPDHPIYGWCHPVMTSGMSTGARGLPLKPGESRAFEVEIASCLDVEDSANSKRFAASPSLIRFAK